MRNIIAGLFIALAALLQGPPAGAATTQLPPGEQCFVANSPTSGGTAGIITATGTITGGSGYVSGGYANVPLTGGSGSGATANITVSGGVVTAVTIINRGFHYIVGDNLSATNANLGGSGSGLVIPVSNIQGTGTGLIGLLGPITGGSLYTNGTYGNVPLTGGLGSGATANITVSGGAVTALTIVNPGIQYVVGDVLSAAAASIGGTGSGFSISVSSVSVNASLAGGQVSMFVPNTTTPKATWQDPNQVTANTQPIILDANGCAIIFGTGSYRQILQDSLGNTIWDQLTVDTSAQQNTFWAGQAGGTPNVITLTDPGFNGTDGSVINFTALSTNTGPTTINPSSFGAITVLKDTTTGPTALSGNEITATNPVSVIYRSVDNAFHILNPILTTATGTSAPMCGAWNLKVTPDLSLPNTKVDIVASEVVMDPISTGAPIKRSNGITTTINLQLSGAGGLDTGTQTASTWYSLWLIDNGITTAGIASLSQIRPTMPGGYSYACIIGWVATAVTNNLVQSVQAGNVTFNLLTSNGPPPLISSGTAGTWSATNPSLAAVTIAGNGFCAPPGATDVFINASNTFEGLTTANVLVAPNNTWGATSNGPSGANGVIWPVALYSATPASQQFHLRLENTQIFWASSAAGGALSCQGYRVPFNIQ